MTVSKRILLTGFASAVLLAGCSSADEDGAASEEDAAVAGALDDDIMTDPDLSGQNGAAMSAEGGSVELPPEQRTPEAIAAAKQEAAKAAGGTIRQAPQARSGASASLVEGAATAAQVAERSKAAATDCASKAKYSMNWASKLPGPLAVYPRAAVQEAAGIDDEECSLAVVNFVTPVSTDDVISYYYTRAQKAGYSADYRMDGSEHVLGGQNGGKAYLIMARERDDGLTGVDLISSGK